MAEMRRCIGSTRYGIEPHEAPVEDFPKQPSQKDGLGRMCRVHWNQYTAGLARDRKARLAAEGGEPAKAKAATRAKPAKPSHAAKVAEGKPAKGETPAATARRKTFEKRLAKVGVGSDAGQKMLEEAAMANGTSRVKAGVAEPIDPADPTEAELVAVGIVDAEEIEAKVAEEEAAIA